MFDNGSFLRRRKRYKRSMKGVMSPYAANRSLEPPDCIQNGIGFPLQSSLPPFIMPNGQFRLPTPSFVIQPQPPHTTGSMFGLPSLPSHLSQSSSSAAAKNEAMRSLLNEGKTSEPTKFSIDNIIGGCVRGSTDGNTKRAGPLQHSLTDNHILAAAAVGLPILPVHWASLERLKNQLRLPVNSFGIPATWYN